MSAGAASLANVDAGQKPNSEKLMVASNAPSTEQPANLDDGSEKAPTGLPEFPNLLSSYYVRPPWKVAGVDYHAGVPANISLKNPSAINLSGATVNAISHIVTVRGDGITLDGYDFSLDGGWQVAIQGSNVTVRNSKFKVGSNRHTPIYVEQTAANPTIEYNTIDGSQSSNGLFGLIQCNGIGAVTIRYNAMMDAYAEGMVIGNNSDSAAFYVIRYNFIKDVGYGFVAGAHGDWIQQYNAAGKAINNLQINFNTFIQTVAPGGGATQGISLHSANIKQGPVISETVTNNTIVATGIKTVSYAVIVDTTNLRDTATVSNNFIVPAGIAYGWSFFGAYNRNGNDGVYNGVVTATNNRNMITGVPLAERRPPPPRTRPLTPAEAR